MDFISCTLHQSLSEGSFLLHAVGSEGGGGHSLQSYEKSLVRGKVKVGEAELATTAGAELMPLDTTEDAGTWRARKSAPGLVGSSVGRRVEGGGEGARGRGKGGRKEKNRENVRC